MSNPFDDIAQSRSEYELRANIIRTVVEKARIGYAPAAYIIEVRGGHILVEYIERTYADFVKLRQALILESPGAPTPALPPAQNERFNGGLGEERQPMLNEFLQVCTSTDHPYSRTKALRVFLKPVYADLLAHNEHKVLLEGFLHKQGHNVKNWRKRWFALRSHPQISIAYFKDPRDSVPAGLLFLSDSAVVREPDGGECDRPYGFVIEDSSAFFGSDESEKSYLLVAGSTPEEKEIWIKTINEALHPPQVEVRPSRTGSVAKSNLLARPVPAALNTVDAEEVEVDFDDLSIGGRRRATTDAKRLTNTIISRLIASGKWPTDHNLMTVFLDLSQNAQREVILGLLEMKEPPEYERPIDYVLQYSLPPADMGRRRKVTELKNRWLRDIFLGILLDAGCHITEVASHDQDEIFVHVYVPMPVLCQVAEEMSLRMPARLSDDDEEIDQHQYSMQFEVHRYMDFSGFEYSQTFFSPSYRSLITAHILNKILFRRPGVLGQKEFSILARICPCVGRSEVDSHMKMLDDRSKGGEAIELHDMDGEEPDDMNRQKRPKLGLNNLINDQVFLAAYPLHTEDERVRVHEADDEYKDEVKVKKIDVVTRKWLLNNWAKKPFTRQPLDRIKNYFGAKVALYFGWLEFYTLSLIIPAILGLIVVIVGVTTTPQPPDGFTLDSVLTIPFAIFMALWATLFLEFWKRRNSELAYRWDTMAFEETETLRPDFHGEWKKSEVTGEMELWYPSWKRKFKFFIGSFGIATLLVCVFAAALGILSFRIMYQARGLVYKVYAGALNAVVIMILNVVYGILAQKLTDWENHRTETEYEDMLIAKTFLFQCVNSYIVLFYIAFFKSTATFWTQLGFQNNDSCSPDCLTELTIQLGSLFISKIVIDNLMEVFIPLIKFKIGTWREMRGAGSVMDMTQWEREAKLPEYPGTFDDYTEMIIQFGYVTLFVASFPIAPLLALINNIVEMRSDATKLLIGLKRPPALLAQDIGTWYSFLNILSMLAVITNTLLLSFTSSQFSFSSLCTGTDCVVWWKLWIFIILEHAIFIVKLVIAEIVPDTPEWITTAIKRDEFRAEKLRQAEDRIRRMEASGGDEIEQVMDVYDPDNRESFTQVAELMRKLHNPDVEALLPHSQQHQAEEV